MLAKHAARLRPRGAGPRGRHPARPSWSPSARGGAAAAAPTSPRPRRARPRRPLARSTRRWPASASSGRSATTPLNGELALLREEHARLQDDTRREIQRLYDEEGTLRAAVDDQTAHLGRTYAEIERLNGMLREMEATRAWRVHQWLGAAREA